MEHTIHQAILNHSGALFGQPVEAGTIQFQKTKKEFVGDSTRVLFPFLKLAGKSPQELGEQIGTLLRDELQLIRNYSIVGGFLNLEYAESYWLDLLRDIDNEANFGYNEPNSKPAIMVEYSSPNTNKPLHLGHLRNNFLGYSVAEILKAYGHEVIKTQIINDRGIHICKSMLAWQKFSPVNAQGERDTPANTGMKGDKLVGKYYVEFDKHFNEEAKAILQQWEFQDTRMPSSKSIPNSAQHWKAKMKKRKAQSATKSKTWQKTKPVF
jgi:arginyl-tRNA synthetase